VLRKVGASCAHPNNRMGARNGKNRNGNLLASDGHRRDATTDFESRGLRTAALVMNQLAPDR
jgi:hypothetical protein